MEIRIQVLAGAATLAVPSTPAFGYNPALNAPVKRRAAHAAAHGFHPFGWFQRHPKTAHRR